METIEFNTAALDGFGAIMSYAEKQMNRHPARKPRPAGVSQPLINSIRKRLIDLDLVLYEGNWEHSGRYPSQSEADLALCGRIAGICKKSNLSAEEAESVIKEIFRQSGLFRQVKWKTVQTHTIPKALSTYCTVRSNGEETESQDNVRPPEKVWTKDNLFADMTLKESDVKLMMDAKFLVPNMIVQGHLGA
jgi:primase-polymerase (primpol)-like protein